LAKARIAVIGAGVAGLAAASRCIERGEKDVVVLEAGPVPGGLGRSVDRNGFRFDLGPHQIHTPYDEVVRFLERLLAAELLVEKKRASQRFLGREVNYPLSFNDVLFRLPPWISLRSFASYLRQRLAGAFVRGEPANFEEWVVRNFGSFLYGIYFGPYTAKVWGLPPALMTARSAAERIAVPGLLDVLLNMFSRRLLRFGKHYDLPHSPYQRVFRYPKHGIGQVAETMAGDIRAAGGRILCNREVTRLSHNTGSVAIECGDGSRLEAEQLLSTMPVDRLQLMLDGRGGEDHRLRLRYRSLVMVMLEVARPKVTPYHWIYFPDRDCIFQRSTEFGNFSNAMAPAGKTGLCLEIPCDHGDSVWNMDADALLSRCLDDAQRQEFLAPGWIEGSHVVRERHAYPMFDLESEGKLRRIMDRLAGFPRVQSIGRQGEFRYINIDGVLLSAQAAADRALSPGRR
jgi:protoporphyrinogen oxidase